MRKPGNRTWKGEFTVDVNQLYKDTPPPLMYAFGLQKWTSGGHPRRRAAMPPLHSLFCLNNCFNPPAYVSLFQPCFAAAAWTKGGEDLCLPRIRLLAARRVQAHLHETESTSVFERHARIQGGVTYRLYINWQHSRRAKQRWSSLCGVIQAIKTLFHALKAAYKFVKWVRWTRVNNFIYDYLLSTAVISDFSSWGSILFTKSSLIYKRRK